MHYMKKAHWTARIAAVVLGYKDATIGLRTKSSAFEL